MIQTCIGLGRRNRTATLPKQRHLISAAVEGSFGDRSMMIKIAEKLDALICDAAAIVWLVRSQIR